MKVLHTADWHLGQRLLDNDRREEHQHALDFLLKLIKDKAIDVVIVAGDIFDTANPPNYALSQYYNFLRKLLDTTCKAVVIIGGNHDSPALLNAPSALLKALNVFVVGAASVNVSEGIIDYKKECIAIQNEDNQAILQVAAVPYLRDKDLRLSIEGEMPSEKAVIIREAIKAHYKAIADYVDEVNEVDKVPIIGTGHLYVRGSQLSDSEQDIHLGNLGGVSSEIFPPSFSYVALGHLHRPQVVGGNEKVRYSGSLIPLSFSERNDKKQVVLLSFEGNTLQAIESIDISTSRKLLRVKGELEKVTEALHKLADENTELAHWVEVIIENPAMANLLIEEKLRQISSEHTQFEILKIKVERKEEVLRYDYAIDLEDIRPEEVFQKRCEENQLSEEQTLIMKNAFQELVHDMQENSEL